MALTHRYDRRLRGPRPSALAAPSGYCTSNRFACVVLETLKGTTSKIQVLNYCHLRCFSIPQRCLHPFFFNLPQFMRVFLSFTSARSQEPCFRSVCCFSSARWSATIILTSSCYSWSSFKKKLHLISALVGASTYEGSSYW